MITDQVPGISKLTREEKFALASELWDEVFDLESDGSQSDSMKSVVQIAGKNILKTLKKDLPGRVFGRSIRKRLDD